MSEGLLVSATIGSEPYLRYLPVMITRLLLSLKKANASQEQAWGLRELSTHTTMEFAESRCGTTTGSHEMCLEIFASTREETQSRTRLCKGYY